MAPMHELDRFRKAWDMEAHTTQLQNRCRPTSTTSVQIPYGRSIGEMAWHLCEIEGYISYGVVNGAVTFQEVPPNLQRPREVRLRRPDIDGYTTRRWRDSQSSPRHSSTGSWRSPTGRWPFGISSGARSSHLVHHRGSFPDVPARGRHAAGHLRAEPGGDDGNATEDASDKSIAVEGFSGPLRANTASLRN